MEVFSDHYSEAFNRLKALCHYINGWLFISAHALDEFLGVANKAMATRRHIERFLWQTVQATAMALKL